MVSSVVTVDSATQLRADLKGKRILVTRAGTAAESFISRLIDLGALPVHCPAIAIAPLADYSDLDSRLFSINRYDWILFTSANAVHAFSARMIAVHGDVDMSLPSIGVVGAATAAAVRSHGWSASYLANGRTGAALAAEVPAKSSARVLVPCADIASDDVYNGLRARDLLPECIVAYRTVDGVNVSDLMTLLRQGGLHAITFASPSSVKHFVEGTHRGGYDAADACSEQAIAVVCIGPTTSDAARAQGLTVACTAITPSDAGLIDALAQSLA